MSTIRKFVSYLPGVALGATIGTALEDQIGKLLLANTKGFTRHDFSGETRCGASPTSRITVEDA